MKTNRRRRRRRPPYLFDVIAGIILGVTAVVTIVLCSNNQSKAVVPEPTETPLAVVTTAPTTEPTTEPTEPPILYSPEELEMLACVIYQEAGSDACCDDCRRRVADVVLNRVADERFPDSIYGVLTQERQYGRYYWTGIVWPERASNPGEAHAVARAYQIAEEVLTGQHSELYARGYIWQAEFKQGSGVLECCGIYFGK